jgi:hypothetical protein
LKTNDLKKGDRVQLRNGWLATIEDNLKGNTRMATVEGSVTEIGSVYSHDIKIFFPEGVKNVFEDGENRQRIDIELTTKQIKFMEIIKAAGF